MADNKILYDVDFNVHTESISQGVAKAVAAGLGNIDRAIQSLGQRVGHPHLYENVRNNLGLIGESGVGLSVSEFAALAASPKYNYTPSTIQTMIRHAADVALKDRETSVDMQYKLDMEEAINELRAAQNRVKKASLAAEYQQQGQMYYALAEAASSPEEKRILLGRAASRYGSIGARTLLESGAISPEAAAAALSNAATLGTLRSDIMTDNQILAYNARVWRSSPNVLEPKAEAAFAATKASQEDLAWASRGYSEKQKSAEMEMGFRAMEASSATDVMYNANADPEVARYGILSSIDSAKRYANLASTYEAGSAGRRASIMLAKESLRGVSVGAMSKAGMTREDIAKNTMALIELTDTLKRLAGTGGGGDDNGPSVFEQLYSGSQVGRQIGGFISAGTGIARDIMKGRGAWLANTKTPYEQRQETILGWGEKYGAEAIGGGAAIGAAIGTAILPGIGTIIGGAIGGGVPALVSLKSTHKLNEKHISDEFRARAIDMSAYFNLYGNRAEYNYAQMAGQTGYTSMESVMGLTQAADMFPGALAFGAASEQQMMALSYFPNYWKGIMEGASTSELLERYRYDAERTPKIYRQYLTSLLPGMDESLRAYAMSDAFNQVGAERGTLRGYDENQRRYIPDLERTQVWRAGQNVRKVNENMNEQIPELDYPDIIRSTDESWSSGDVKVVRYSAMSGTKSGAWDAVSIIAEGVTRAMLDLTNGNPFMSLNIMLDTGQEVTSQNLGFSNWIGSNQSLTIGR